MTVLFENIFAPLDWLKRLQTWHIVAVCFIMAASGFLSAWRDPAVRAGDSLYTYVLAANVAEGKGYGLNCVDHFHKKYVGGTWVVDAFRAPLGPLVYAPLRWITSDREQFYLACTWLNVLIGSFLLPWLAALIAGELFSSRLVVRMVALMVALHPLLAEAALSCAHDLLAVVFQLISFWAFLRCCKNGGWWWALVGFTLGLAYITKETALAWLVAYVLAAVFLRIRGQLVWLGRLWAPVFIGVILFLMPAGVWSIRNTMVPPDARLEKSSVGLLGMDNRLFRQGDRIPLWWRPGGGGFHQRFTVQPPIAVVAMVTRNLAMAGVQLFTGIFVPGLSDYVYDPDFATPYYGIPFEVVRALERKVRPDRLSTGEPAPAEGADFIGALTIALRHMTFYGLVDGLAGRSLYVTALAMAALAGAWRFRRDQVMVAALIVLSVTLLMICGVTHMIARYVLFHYILLAIMAAGGLVILTGAWRRAITVALVVGAAVGFAANERDWHHPPAGSVNATRIALRADRVAVARWFARQPNRDRLVVLSDRAIWIHAYSGMAGVTLPFSPVSSRQLEVLADVMSFYGVTHVVIPTITSLEASLFEPLIKSVQRGDGWLELKHETEHSRIFRVHPDRAPPVIISGRPFTREELFP